MISPILTNAEMEIMQVIWDLGKASVRDVHEVLESRKQVAYTTIMTMMKILEDKGHLCKVQLGRAYIYSPVRSRQQVTSSMLSEFLNRVYEGSARELVLNLVDDSKLSDQELKEIARIIEEKQ